MTWHPLSTTDSVLATLREAIDALIDAGRVPPKGTVLEVGAGTGQLTVSLARRGLRVTAVEPGSRMAALLARKLSHFPNCAVMTATFEEASIEPGTFDLVTSATAFHWVDETRRFSLAAAALHKTGALALLRNDHVASSASAAYYRGVRPIYERYAPKLAQGFHLRAADKTPGFVKKIKASGIFHVRAERRFT